MHGVARRRFFIYGFAIFFSLLLSTWAALKTSVINPDAICYLASAAAMSKGLMVATHLCAQAKWPFYSMLIFGLSHLTGFSYLTAAYLLDGFFSLISVVTFIAIVSTLTLRTRIVALSAAVILLAHKFNALRVEIVRDHGFWAFYLLSFFFLLQYFNVANITHTQKKLHQWCYALLWSVSLVVATLFRIEGIIFLILLPYLVFFEKRTQITYRLGHFFQLNLLAIVGCVALLSWMLIHPEQYLGRLPEIKFQMSHGLVALTQSFYQLVQALAHYVLNSYSVHDANKIAVGMLLSWYMINVVANISLIYAVLILYAWWKKLGNFTPQTKRILWAYIAINVSITLVFLVDNLFLAQRYLIALSLVLMLWVPFTLDDLIYQWRVRRWPLLLAIILIGIYGLSGVFNWGHSKKYIRNAGDWLALHAAAHSKIYSNDYQVLYYSQHVGDDIFTLGKGFFDSKQIANGKWQQYDYVALRINKNELMQKKWVLNEFHFQPVSLFQNERGDQVRIYQIRKTSGESR